MSQGHSDYRFICHERWRRIQEVHPSLAEAGNSSIGRISLRPAAVGDENGVQEVYFGEEE